MFSPYKKNQARQLHNYVFPPIPVPRYPFLYACTSFQGGSSLSIRSLLKYFQTFAYTILCTRRGSDKLSFVPVHSKLSSVTSYP